MPTFGQTGDQAGFSTSSIAKTAVSLATPTASGTVDSANARIWMDYGWTNVKFCIYANTGGEPGAKLAESDEFRVENTIEEAVGFVFSGANRINVTTGTSYWIGPAWDDPGESSISYSRNTTASGRRETSSYAPGLFGTPTVLSGPLDAFVTFLIPAPPATVDATDGAFFDFF